MARFLFAAVGASGHVNPTLPVAAELVRRGHEVGYGTGRHMEGAVTPEVTRFFPVGPDLGPDSADRPEWAKFGELRGRRRMAFAIREILFPLAETTSRELLDIAESFKPDALVFDFMTFASNIVAGVSGLPWATTTPVPGLLQGGGAHPFGLDLPYTSNRVLRMAWPLYWLLANAAMSFQYDRQFNAIRSRFDLPPIRNAFFTGAVSPYLVLAFAPRELEYPRDAWPPPVHFVGPGLAPATSRPEMPDWLESLPSGRPLIYATLGTSPNAEHLAYLETLIEAVRDIEADVVVTVGTAARLPASSGNVRIERWVPNGLIIPKARIVMHQGGSTTMFETLAHGKPAVVTPFEDGQAENALRLRWVGAGTMVNPYKASAPKLRAAIDAVLGSDAMGECASGLAEALGQYDAGRTGAGLLERLARTGEPVPADRRSRGLLLRR